VKFHYNNTSVLTLILACIIIVLLFLLSPFLHILNKQVQNSYYGVKNDIAWLQAHPNILLVELDQETIDSVWAFPFERSVYATVIENLLKYDTGVIAFDFLFLDPSQEEQDEILKSAFDASDYVVVGAGINSKRELQTPYEWFELSENSYWFLSPNIDKSNNTVYTFSPQFTDKSGNIHEHFTVKILRQLYRYLYEDEELLLQWHQEKNYYSFSDTVSFPLASKNNPEILINFIPEENFQKVSFLDILSQETLWEIEREIWLRDKIILIGPAADGLNDEFYTPNGREYGMYIHANILNTLLSQQYMMYFDRYLEWLLIFFILILSAHINLSRNKKVLIIGNIAIILIFWFLFPLSVLLWTNLILNFPSEIIFSLLLAFTWANIVKFLMEDANKKKLNSALSEYVSSNIAEEILAEKWKINFNGQKKHLVCFFSDIESFTSLSEDLSPEELVAFLREYLGEMTEIIMDNAWYVDKYEWDAIMALWGAFTDHSPQDYISACETALMQQKKLGEINKKWKERLWKNISARIWIHAGEAIIWNIWAVGRKMDFTALWDNVNLASRLEWVNKYYGTYICVSEVMYEATKEKFYFRYLDEIQVKWKDIPVKIYELRGLLCDKNHEEVVLMDIFAQWIEKYKNMDFIWAKKIFESLSSDDEPSNVYVGRCEYFIKNPPEEDWDTVWRMQEK